MSDPDGIQNVIYSYYKDLFGHRIRSKASLKPSAREHSLRLGDEDVAWLTRPFTLEEVKQAIFYMKEDSAPGPDGFPVSFYKKYWELVQGLIMEMVNDFYLGNLDITRLNYGVITLVPKVLEANDVRQFRPICLLNVSFKIFTKLLMARLSTVIKKIVSSSQIAFIKGRFILDSTVMLHEIMHELKSKKSQRGGL